MENKKNKILWCSSNQHIIIVERMSFYNEDEIIYVIYIEHRNYRKFNSKIIYNVNWSMERWEYSLEKAIKYAEELEDQFIED